MKLIKKTITILSILFLFWNCKTTSKATTNTNISKEIAVTIDLVNVQNDKVQVTVTPPTFTTETATFMFPKTVPGTYSISNYGKFIDDVKVFDNKGNELPTTKTNKNSYRITNASKIKKITYWVNDTFDSEKGGGFGNSDDIFSPAGTNIEKDTNFVLNTHGFIGYFSTQTETPYKLTVLYPENLTGASALTNLNPTKGIDVFKTQNYARLVENPMMYTIPNNTSFTIDGMDIIISVYSPNNKFTADDLTANMKTMMTAQKRFLGDMDTTKKYAILLYLSDLSRNDAGGFGALEHPTSTTVVMPEMMSKEMLEEQLKDVVSHEFFHIVTPLTVHSDEIKYFNFNNPKMSEHLWMYEGVTEYFANLFQVNQNLIDENNFFNRMSDKITQSKQMNDKMSFTKMSKNVLQSPYKEQYLNVYNKGALIAMCIDIIIREKSDGKKGILNLMHQLSNEYGTNKSFKDSELFDKITELTYPEVGQFLTMYVAGETPIPYDDYFAKMGVSETTIEVLGNPFLKGKIPYITINPSTKEILFLPSVTPNAFMKALQIQPGDTLVAINDKNYNMNNINELIMESMLWKEGTPITVTIKREGKEQKISGKIVMPKEKKSGYRATDTSKQNIREAWLRG